VAPYVKIIFFLGILALLSQPAWARDLKVGDAAPGFSTVDDGGRPVSLQDFLGKTVILYFYPKDDTPGCTIEAKGFRELYAEFQKKDVVILGISYDDKDSHGKFKKKYEIPYALLVDEDRSIAEAYGAKGSFFAARQTFVIDPHGNIRFIYRNVNPSGHAEEILKNL